MAKNMIKFLGITVLCGCLVYLLFVMFAPKEDLIPTIQVNGVLYYDTGCVNETDVRSDEPDGTITSYVESYQLPEEDNQANFGNSLEYQFGAIEGTIEVYIKEYDYWLIFANEKTSNTYDFKSKVNIPHK